MSTLVGILSCEKYKHTRQAAVRETWMQEVQAPNKAVFIVGGASHTHLEGDTLFCNAPDNYSGLTLKMLEFWKWSLTQGHDTIFKCDDDTYLAFHRMHLLGNGALLGSIRRSKAAHKCRFPSGGAGYRVRTHYLASLLKHYDGERFRSCEDLAFGVAAAAIGVNRKHSGLLRQGSSGYPSPKNSRVTGHYISPALMRRIYLTFQPKE